MRHWIVVVVVLGLATAARAERITKVFPLAGAMPRSLRDTPGELTRVIAKRYSADLAKTSIEIAAEASECNIEKASCLASIAENVEADKIIFGRIERAGEGLLVTLRSFDRTKGSEPTKRFEIEGADADELAQSLAEQLKGKTKIQDQKVPPIEKPTEPPLPPLPPAEGGSGRITKGTWTMIIGGGLGVATGAGFLFGANNVRGEIARAPRNNEADFQYLVKLENTQRLYAGVGIGLVLAGGVVTTIGTIRAIKQRKNPSSDPPLVDVVPESGGASIRFNLRWP